MDYRLIDYDICEYKDLQNYLTQESEKGYNIISPSKISKFKKNDKKYYYYVDILTCSHGKKRKMTHDLANEYERQFFDYVGSIDNFLIFRSESKRKIPANRQQEINDYLKNRFISVLTYFALFMAFLGYFSFTVLNNIGLDQLVTNGNVLLLYVPLFMLVCVVVRFINKILLSLKYTSLSNILKKVFYVLTIATSVSFVLAVVLDIVERKEAKVDDTVLRLEDFNLDSNSKDYPNYDYSSSFITSYKGYTEANGEDAISSEYYTFKDEKNARKYYDQLVDVYKDCKLKELDENTSILQMEGQYDSVICRYENKLIYVTTTVDINDHISMIKDYMKK